METFDSSVEIINDNLTRKTSVFFVVRLFVYGKKTTKKGNKITKWRTEKKTTNE